MTDHEKLRACIEALTRVAKFGHDDDCFSGAPLYECCCYDKSQSEIAEECLREIGEA